jgi:hypothetical protein
MAARRWPASISAQIVRTGQRVEEEILRRQVAGRGKRARVVRLGPHHPLHLPQVVDDRRGRPHLRIALEHALEIVDGAHHLGLLDHAVGVALDENAHRRGAREARVHDGVVSPHGAARREELAEAVVDVHQARAGQRHGDEHRGDRQHGSRPPDHQVGEAREHGSQPALAARAQALAGRRGRHQHAHGRDERHLDHQALRMPNAIRSPKTRTLVTWTSRATRSRRRR